MGLNRYRQFHGPDSKLDYTSRRAPSSLSNSDSINKVERHGRRHLVSISGLHIHAYVHRRELYMCVNRYTHTDNSFEPVHGLLSEVIECSQGNLISEESKWFELSTNGHGGKYPAPVGTWLNTKH